MTERMVSKMAERPWTCVYTHGPRTLIVTEFGEFDRHVARQSLQDQYPGYDLRALIPGDHTVGALVVEPSTIDVGNARKAAVEAPRFVDPFDTGSGH